MNIAGLVDALGDAGFDLDPVSILDALWLAARAPPITLGTGESRSSQPSQSEPQGVPVASHSPARPSTPVDTPVDDGIVTKAPSPDIGATPRMIAAFAEATVGGGARRASAVSIGAAPPLATRLGLMRAVRQFQQPWRSPAMQELDEEATAEVTAELRMTRPDVLVPVLKPRRERWFDVDLVLEDDDAVLLWGDMLGDFAQALRDTGAFRVVRRWRLVLDSEAPARGRPMLQAPSGARSSASTLNGAERRLILFATHGGSKHWTNGAYLGLLARWAPDSAVAVIPLLPARSWKRTRLGDPAGVCSTDRVGAASGQLDAHPFWWSNAADESDVLVLPLVELTPRALEIWSTMLMGRGRPAPALLLPRAVHGEESAETGKPTLLDEGETARRVAALREASPEAFRLATLLCLTSFTVPVARLIQEAQFGRVNQEALSELFVSGLLEARPSSTGDGLAASFVIQEHAATLLRRSLNGRNAEAVADALIARVSDHIRSRTGTVLSQTVFTPDESGRFALPDEVQPFAMVAAKLRASVAERRPGAPSAVSRLHALSASSLRRLLRAARSDNSIRPDLVDTQAWAVLQAPEISRPNEMGHRILTNVARRELDRIDRTRPLLGGRILWVDDRPSNIEGERSLFEREGAQVRIAETTKEALETLGDGTDVIISDMARREGEREGLALLRSLRDRGIGTPVVIYTANYARSRRNRTEAKTAGAHAVTNDPRDLAQIVRTLLREVVPLDVDVASSRPSRAADDHALILTSDAEGERIHARSGEAFAILAEDSLGVRADNLVRRPLDELFGESPSFSTLFPTFERAAGGSDGTLYVYAASLAMQTLGETLLLDSKHTAALPIESIVSNIRAAARFKQVMLVIDCMVVSSNRRPRIWTLLPLTPTGSPRPSFFEIVAQRKDRSVHRTRETVLPMTRKLIETIEGLAGSASTPAVALKRSLTEGRQGMVIRSSDEFALPHIPPPKRTAIRTWEVHDLEAVSYANQRDPTADVLALRSIERALALRPDLPDPTRIGRLHVHRAALLKRLDRLDDAEAALSETRSLWAGTPAEADAWYNLACIYAMTSRREAMLDALFATRGDVDAVARVRSHLGDYFEQYARDRSLLAFLSGKSRKRRDTDKIGLDDFCTRAEILVIAGEAESLEADERPRHQLLIFSTERQSTWLVATKQSLIFLLDDANTRRSRRLVQLVMPLQPIPQVKAERNRAGATVVRFGAGKQRTSWYYSPQIFATPHDIEDAIGKLIGGDIVTA